MSERELYRPGYFTGRLIYAQPSQAETGTPQIVMGYDVNGYEARVYLFVTTAAAPHTKEKLARHGWVEGTYGPMKFAGPLAAQLRCWHDTEYDGNPREKWDYQGGRPEDAKPETKHAICSLLGYPPGKAQPAAPAAPARPAARPNANPKQGMWDAIDGMPVGAGAGDAGPGADVPF